MNQALVSPFKSARDYLGFTQTQMAKKLEVSQGLVSKLDQGNNIGYETLVKFANLFPEININWLLTGQGSMLVGQASLNHQSIARSEFPISKSLFVPVVARRAFLSPTTDRAPAFSYLAIPGLSGESITFEIQGQTMDPVLSAGDFVVCQSSNIPQECVCVLVLTDQRLIIGYALPEFEGYSVRFASRFEPTLPLIKKDQVKSIYVARQFIRWSGREFLYSEILSLKERIENLESK